MIPFIHRSRTRASTRPRRTLGLGRRARREVHPLPTDVRSASPRLTAAQGASMKRLVSSRLLRCAATAEILFVVACGGGGSAPPGALLLSGINPTVGSAVGGTPVTLVGTNFQAGATVTFGAAQATGVTYDSSNALSAITPAGALGAVNVTVTNPDGQSSVLTSGFTYQEPTCAVPALITGDTTLGPTCIWVATATVNVGELPIRCSPCFREPPSCFPARNWVDRGCRYKSASRHRAHWWWSAPAMRVSSSRRHPPRPTPAIGGELSLGPMAVAPCCST